MFIVISQETTKVESWQLNYLTNKLISKTSNWEKNFTAKILSEPVSKALGNGMTMSYQWKLCFSNFCLYPSFIFLVMISWLQLEFSIKQCSRLCVILGGEWRWEGFGLERVFEQTNGKIRTATSVINLSISSFFPQVFVVYLNNGTVIVKENKKVGYKSCLFVNEYLQMGLCVKGRIFSCPK